MNKSNNVLKFLFIFLFIVFSIALIGCEDADRKAATAVDDTIEALPAAVTLNDETAIVAARDMFEKLTETQKALVTKIDALASKEMALTDLKAIKAVEDLISNIPEIITLNDESKIQTAQVAYNALKSLLKGEVSNYQKLVQAKEDYDALVALEAAIQAVKDLIDELPEVEDVTLYDEEDINDAKEAFEALDSPEQSKVINADKLNAVVAKIAQLKVEKENREAAEAVDLIISRLPVNVTLNDKEDVSAARIAYDALTVPQQELVISLDKLIAAEEKIIDLEAALVVINLIADLPAELTLDNENDVIAVRTAYNSLSEERQALVANYNLLLAKEKEIIILKNPDLGILYPIIEQVPEQIIDDYELPTAEGVVWAYKNGEDESLFDIESGEILKTTFDTAYRIMVVTYNKTSIEVKVNFGLIQEGLIPIYYVGGADTDKPEGGNNWDGHGTWDKQLEKTGFGGYLIEYGDKVYFISKDAFIPIAGEEGNNQIDRKTLRPYGFEGQDSLNNNGLINGNPSEYKGTGALYYNSGDVAIKFYGCDTYGRVNAVFAGYGKIVFSKQIDGTYKVGPMIPEHGGTNDPGNTKGTVEGDYVITLNPGDYLWTPHTWEADYGNIGWGTRLCGTQGVLQENTNIVIKKFKYIQENQ